MVRCYKNCANCGYHEHAEPCCPKPCCGPAPCCPGVPCEHSIHCADPVCMRPCWDTCKCMDEILKLQKNEDKDQAVINNLEGRVEKVEKDFIEFNGDITEQFGRLAQKEQHDFDCLNDKIDEEKDRAIAEEQRIEARVAAEEQRAQQREAELADAIGEERERAINRENEIDNRVAAEEARAQAKENELNQAINDEVTRATNRENQLDNRIANEETRAQAKEDEISSALNREINRATSNEDRIEDLVSAEETRAENREDEIAANLAAESSDRLMNAITDAEYVPSQKKINFKRQNGDIVAVVDATDFVRDGMVDSVVWNNRQLIITWNTDSGKQQTIIPGDQIFNPDNYYTKADIDQKTTAINTDINLLNTNLATTNSNLTSLTNKVNNTVDYGQTIDWGTTETLALVNGTPITAGIPEFPNVVSNVLVDNNGHLVVYDTDHPQEPRTYDLPAGYINRVTHLEELTEQQQTTINNLVNTVIPALEARIQALEADNLWQINPNNSNQVIAKNNRSAAAYGFYDTDPNMI